MAKDFCFLFYVNDWAGGTMGMNRLQRGGYLDLLLYQFHNTCFSLDEVKNILGSDFDNIWNAVKHKFKVNPAGKFFNEKMKTVSEDRKAFTESRRTNRLGKTKKLKKNIRKTHDKRMEDERENENVIVFSNIIYPFDSDNFKRSWKLWKDYRAEIKKPYGSSKSEQMALKKLSEFTEIFAIHLIEKSISNGWQGLIFSSTQQEFNDFNRTGILNHTGKINKQEEARLARENFMKNAAD